MCWDLGVEFLVVALAGTFAGAGLGATRVGAPRWTRVGFFLLAVAALVVSILLLT